MKRTRFAVPVLLLGCWLLSSWLLPATAFADDPIPALHAVPAGLSPEVETRLSRERESLDKKLRAFLADAGRFNAKPAEAQTDAEYAALQARRRQCVSDAEAFNRAVTKAVSAIPQHVNTDVPAQGTIGTPPVDSDVVDLRVLDPNSPIFVDPNVVKGRERTFPVQLDPETYKNANHNKGVEALQYNDPDLAVRYFEAARKERPNDPIIHNMLLLAQDIARVRQEKTSQAHYWGLQAIAAVMTGDPTVAKSCLARARDLAPDDKTIRYWAVTLEGTTWSYQSPAFADQPTRNAFRIAGHGLYSLANDDVAVAVKNFETAQAFSPKDPTIAGLARMVREYAARKSGARR